MPARAAARLDPLIANIQALSNANGLGSPSTLAAGLSPVDVAALLPSSTQGYYYFGSLTTPPLSVGVNWFVFADAITMDDAQFKALQGFELAANFYTNNRAVQPLDGRSLNEVDYNVNLTSDAPNFAGADFQLLAVTVPEPSSWVLTGLGGAGLLRLSRHRRRPV